MAVIKQINNKSSERMKGRRRLYSLLVGMSAKATTVESSMEVPQQTKNTAAV
jgi:hypothetical protein